MPTYQYACTDCDHAFEQVQSFTEESLTVCPQCEGRLRKVFNAVGVVFKGSGFYRTDSRADSNGGSRNGSGSSKDSTSTDSGSAKESTSKDSGSTKEGSGSSSSSGSSDTKASATSAA